ncbi:MAG: hypothetical protein ACK45R_04450 [Candidatus Kapaibacterium sp.]|jgi:hypothetical protein
MRYLLLCACAAALLAMQACNSSSTPTAEPPNYFKGLGTVGSYWVYENYEIDTNGVTQSTFYLDSTWVAGISVVDGRNASILVSQSTIDGVVNTDTTRIARDSNKLYAYINPAENPLLPDQNQSSWVLVAHLDTSATWNAFNPITLKQDLDFGGTAVSIDIKIEGIISTKGDTAFTAANGVKYTTKNFGLLPKISGKITPKATPFFSFPLSSSGGEQRQFFADGVGLVGERAEPSVFNIGDGTLVPPQKQPGSLRKLLRYSVK